MYDTNVSPRDNLPAIFDTISKINIRYADRVLMFTIFLRFAMDRK